MNALLPRFVIVPLVGSCLTHGASAQTVDVRDVVINEIHYDPGDQDLEFVELYNRSTSPVSLADFELADSRMSPVRLGGTSAPIAPGQFVVVARDADALVARWPDASAAAAIVTPSSWPALNNTGDAVVLLLEGLAIDSVSFVPAWGGDGVSLERVDPNGPSPASSNWASSLSQSSATPGLVNSVYAPDREPPRVVFAEHATDPTVVVVTFSEPIEYLPSEASFSFDGIVPDRVAVNELDPRKVTLHGAPADARSLQVDGVSDYVGNRLDGFSTPIARAVRPGELVVNEIMYEPRVNATDGLPDQVEYVELTNTSQAFLSLRGLRVTGLPDERGIVDTLARVDQPLGLGAGGFAVLFADRGSTSLAIAHPRDYAGLGAVLIPVSASFRLANSGAWIRLYSPPGATIDSLRFDPSWHSPNLRVPTGIALERVDPLGPSADRQNWTSSTSFDGGTPGSRNSVFLSPVPADQPGTLRVEPSPFSPDGDGIDDIAGIAYALASGASLVRIRIFDSRGRQVRTLVESMLSAGTGTVTWDGRSDNGHGLPIGFYVVLVDAIDTVGGNAERHKATIVLARQLN